MSTEKTTAKPPARRPAGVADLTLALPARDVRSKRPPALSFLLRLETLRRVARVASLMAIDYAGLFGAIFTALTIKFVVHDAFTWHGAAAQTQKYMPFAYLVTVLLFIRSDLYADRTQRPGLARIVAALFQVMIVSVIFALATGEQFSTYYIFYSSLAFAAIYIGGMRQLHLWVTGLLLARAGYRRRTVIVGSGRHIEDVAGALSSSTGSPIDIVGFVSLRPRPDNGLRSLGRLEDIEQIVHGNRIQEVVIADPQFPSERAVDLVDACHRQGVSVHVAPSTMEVLMERAEFTPGQSLPLFTLKPLVLEGFDFLLKRTFDLVVSLLVLFFTSPLLLAIAVAIKLTSPGAVLYRSQRPGIGGEPFECLKFRTMRSGADRAQDDLERMNEASGALFKIRDDPRVTPVGRLLRRFSLDELPQLINVVRGEMSLVGPRPLPVRDFDQLDDWHKKRYLVMPGITGLWQVSGRSELSFDDLVRLDFVYLERWSISLDLVILLKTIPAVLSRRGAY